MDEKGLTEDLRLMIRTARDMVDLLEEGVHAPDRHRAIHQSLRETLSAAESLLLSVDMVATARDNPRETVVPCDMVRLTQHVLRATEAQLARRALRVSLSMGHLLPTVSGMPERIVVVLTTFLDYLSRLAHSGSTLKIALREVDLHHGAGVEWRCIAETHTFTERDRYRLFEVIGSNAPIARPTDLQTSTDDLGCRLQRCRTMVDALGGELWVERLRGSEIALVMTVPVVQELPDGPRVPRCKLDVAIENYQRLQQCLGSRRCTELLETVEHVTRETVRYERDTVMGFEQRGLVSVMLAAATPGMETVVERLRRAMHAAGLHQCERYPVEYDFHVTQMR
ncbi:MAG: hypothetical protein HYV02_03715 [Deltaproteobacteria bacterium]|nr:hypothetical protein [Deltaproteobacteria bacterium]